MGRILSEEPDRIEEEDVTAADRLDDRVTEGEEKLPEDEAAKDD